MRTQAWILALSLLGCGDFDTRLDGEVLDATGGTVRAEAAELTLPAGALRAPTLIQITPLNDLPAVMQPHRLDPVATVLEGPAELRLRYDPAAVRTIDPANLRVVRVEGEAIVAVPGGMVDVDAGSVAAPIERLGVYGLAPQCRADAECAAGEACTRGGCAPEAPDCVQDIDCAEGEQCVDGQCNPAPFRCVADSDCGPNEICTDGRCVAGPACRENVDCGPAEVCVEGRCEPMPPDRDTDGVPDAVDNCPDTANPEQADRDRDGVGDACDEPPPGEEICGDAMDNDRDGQIDERICQPACADNIDCAPGQVCIDGACRG